MSRLLELGTIVTRAQQRADRENDGHISAAEWKSLVSEQYGDLYSVVAESGLRHFETTSTITSTGALYYTLPADHLSTVGIARILATTSMGAPPADVPSRFGLELREAMAQEHSLVSGATGEARYYAIVGENIWLYPTPPSGQTYQLRYIPQAPDLADGADDDEIDVVTPDGEAFLLWGVAVKARAKSDENVELAIMEREAARARLTEWAVMRAFHQPRRRIVDEGPGWDFSGGPDDGDWRWGR